MAASIDNYRKQQQNLEQDQTPPELEQMKRRRDGDEMYEHAGSQQEAQDTLLAAGQQENDLHVLNRSEDGMLMRPDAVEDDHPMGNNK